MDAGLKSPGTYFRLASVQEGMDALAKDDQPTWWTAGATALSYGLVLLVLFVLLFVLPYLLFLTL
jgi:hypothetical protein